MYTLQKEPPKYTVAKPECYKTCGLISPGLICIEVHEATCSKPGTDASLETIKPKIKYRKILPPLRWHLIVAK